jgi:putative hemolysin
LDGLGWLVIACLALALGSVLSALAQSLRNLSRTALEEVAAIRNSPGATARVRAILSDLEGHASAVALPRVVCNLLVAVSLIMFVAFARDPFQASSGPGTWDLVIGALSASVLLWGFGVAIPTAVANHAAEITVHAWSPVLRLTYVLLTPLRAIARLVDEIVRRLAGKERTTDSQAIEEELLSVVEEAQVDGQFDQTEREMIEAVVRFRNRTVAQIMTPRTEMEAMPLINDLSAVTAAIRKIGHSRIPVYEQTADRIVGIFYVKDLMRWLAGEGSRAGKGFDLRALLRPAVFVPESKTLRELLGELLAKRVHIAIVADEYGGTSGLVTIEDIVEEVFGEIQDEYERPEEDASTIRIAPGSSFAEFDARIYLADANDALEQLDVELPESEDYDTVGGFITATLGRIPTAGEVLRIDGAQITVIAAEATRVGRIRIESTKNMPEPTPEEVTSTGAEPESLRSGNSQR